MKPSLNTPLCIKATEEQTIDTDLYKISETRGYLLRKYNLENNEQVLRINTINNDQLNLKKGQEQMEMKSIF